jgi:CRP-like cAMP-binding protein
LKGVIAQNLFKRIDKKVDSLGTLKEGNVFKENGLISRSIITANIFLIRNMTVGVIDKETFEDALNNLPEAHHTFFV